MKTKQAFFLGLLGLVSLLSNGQTIATATLTSGGLESGNVSGGAPITGPNGSTFYGYRAGKLNANLVIQIVFLEVMRVGQIL